MSMKDTLKKAKIAAMKAKDKAKLNPINLTLADIQNRDWRTRPLPKPPRPISWKPSCRRPPATRTTPKPSPTPWQK